MHTNKPRGHAIDLEMSKKRKRDPEVIVFEEPTTSRKPRRGREAAKEREKFLVICDSACLCSCGCPTGNVEVFQVL